MRPAAYLVGLANPAGELVVELAGSFDPELVHVQPAGVRAGPGDARVIHAPLQVQVSAERALSQPGTGETSARTLEGDCALRHPVRDRPARAHQPAEPVIQRDDLRRLAEQMAPDRPLGISHARQSTGL